MEVILLERVAKLGHMGETVRVKDGFARNFRYSAARESCCARRTAQSKKKFEGQRHQLEARNLELKSEASRESLRSSTALSFVIIRQAGETGQLYGSVSARDIAETITAPPAFPSTATRSDAAASGITRDARPSQDAGSSASRSPAAIVTINVARSPEEAERQAEGRGSVGAGRDVDGRSRSRSRPGARRSRTGREPRQGVMARACAFRSRSVFPVRAPAK